MTRQFFNQGQEILSSDLNAISEVMESNLLETISSTGLGQYNLLVGYTNATSVYVNEGVGTYYDLAAGAEKRIKNTDDSTDYTIEPADATHDRYDIVMARQKIVEDTVNVARNIKSSLGVIAAESVPVKRLIDCEIQIKTGTAAASPSIPSVDSGWTVLAILHVKAGIGLVYGKSIIDRRYPNLLASYVVSDSPRPSILTSHAWSTPHEAGITISLVSGNLEITKTVSGGSTFNDTVADSYFGGMYWELYEWMNAGYCLKIFDGTYHWVLEPSYDANDDFHAAFVLSGGATATRKLTIMASKIGSVFKVYRSVVPYYHNDGMIPMTDFTGFSTRTEDLFYSSYEIVLWRSPTLVSNYPGQSSDIPRLETYAKKKPFWIRPLVGANYPNLASGSMNYNYDMPLVKGKRYRLSVNAQLNVASAVTLMTAFRVGDPGPPYGGNTIWEQTILTNRSGNQFIGGAMDFIVGSDRVTASDRVCFEATYTGTPNFPAPPAPYTSGNLSTYLAWGYFPVMIVEEI